MNTRPTTNSFLDMHLAHFCSFVSSLYLHACKIVVVRIGLQSLYKRQALTHSPQSRSKPFKKS